MVTRFKETGVFVQECWVELQRVTWPDWAQLKNATLVVIIFCLIISVIIWIMDLASRFFIDVVMGIFGA
jgi:preprotein translocase subunit SecE